MKGIWITIQKKQKRKNKKKDRKQNKLIVLILFFLLCLTCSPLWLDQIFIFFPPFVPDFEEKYDFFLVWYFSSFHAFKSAIGKERIRWLHFYYFWSTLNGIKYFTTVIVIKKHILKISTSQRSKYCCKIVFDSFFM